MVLGDRWTMGISELGRWRAEQFQQCCGRRELCGRVAGKVERLGKQQYIWTERLHLWMESIRCARGNTGRRLHRTPLWVLYIARIGVGVRPNHMAASRETLRVERRSSGGHWIVNGKFPSLQCNESKRVRECLLWIQRWKPWRKLEMGRWNQHSLYKLAFWWAEQSGWYWALCNVLWKVSGWDVEWCRWNNWCRMCLHLWMGRPNR